jgi:hypothetical protein
LKKKYPEIILKHWEIYFRDELIIRPDLFKLIAKNDEDVEFTKKREEAIRKAKGIVSVENEEDINSQKHYY